MDAPRLLLGLDAQDAADLLDRGEVAQRGDGLLERALESTVRDEHELGVAARPLLPPAPDRDVALPEDARDLGEHARAGLDAEQDVVLAGHLGHRTDRALVEAGAPDAARVGEQVPPDAPAGLPHRRPGRGTPRAP